MNKLDRSTYVLQPAYFYIIAKHESGRNRQVLLTFHYKIAQMKARKRREPSAVQRRKNGSAQHYGIYGVRDHRAELSACFDVL